MASPYYVSPEQLMKDKADYARKGIARGRSVIALEYADGIIFVDIDRDTGHLAGAACPRVFREAFIAGTEPSEGCYLHSAWR